MARKSGNRFGRLRSRAAMSDEEPSKDASTVYIPLHEHDDAYLARIEQVEQVIEQQGLEYRELVYLDGGLMVQFRARPQADTFRKLLGLPEVWP